MVVLQDIREAIRDLNLSGQPLFINSSLRSFGWVDGGASTVVDGLLAEGCTVMVPTFTAIYAAPAPPGVWIEQNGWDRSWKCPAQGIDKVYSPDITYVDKDMGVIPATVVSMPGRVRGSHPRGSLTAIGPLAHRLISVQGPEGLWAPLKVLAEVNGTVILVGVDLTHMTFLHMAEKEAGRKPFRRWANGPDGKLMEMEGGCCSYGFNNLEPAFMSVMRMKKVGESVWRIFPARETLEIAVKVIQENPNVTHCPDPDCIRCRDMIAGGPLI